MLCRACLLSVPGLDFRVVSEANSSIVNRKQSERFAETNREVDMSTSKNQAGFHLLTVIGDKLESPAGQNIRETGRR